MSSYNALLVAVPQDERRRKASDRQHKNRLGDGRRRQSSQAEQETRGKPQKGRADRQTLQASSMTLSVGTDGDKKRRATLAARATATLNATAVPTAEASEGEIVAAGGRGTKRSAAHWRKIRSAVTALAAFRRRKVRDLLLLGMGMDMFET